MSIFGILRIPTILNCTHLMSFYSHRHHDRVKLHVTVLNSLYRNKLEDEFEGYKEGAPRVKMDARCAHCPEYYFFNFIYKTRCHGKLCLSRYN